MKKNVMVSIDQELHKEAKERQFNVSSITDKALRLKMHGSKRDVPEDAIQLKCTQCGALIDYGFCVKN